MIKSLAFVLGLAAWPLAAQLCPIGAPSRTLPIAPTPVTPSEGASVTLEARGSYPECAPPPPGYAIDCPPGGYFIQSCDTLQWTFGDGTSQTSTGSSSITHTYAHAGLYEVKLHIANALGSADVAGSVYVASSPGTFIDAPRYVDVNEAAGSVTVHVTRSGDLSRTNALNWRLSADPNVMINAQGTLSFAPGETDQALTFPITSDHRYAAIYYSFLYLNLVPDGAVAALLGWDALHMQPTINVHEADPVPVGTIADVTVSKGEPVFRVPVDLSGSFAFPCCLAYLDWHTIDGTARNGVDFTGPETNGDVLIQPDTTRAFIEIPLLKNGEEGSRSFDVEVTYAPFPLARSRAIVTIVDDSVRMSPPSSVVPAGTTIPFRVSAGQPFASGDVITLTSSDPDVAPVPRSVSAAAGATSVTFELLALRPGSTTITATDPRSNRYATAAVSVTAPLHRRAVR